MLGTAFHDWVQRFFHAERLFDLDPAAQDAYVREQVRTAALYGLEPDEVPASRAYLTRYFRRVRPQLRMSHAARTFIGDLSAAKKELEAQAAPLRDIAVAVQHGHSRYLIAWLGIRSVVTIEPDHMVPPGPARLAEIIASVPRQDIKIIVYGVFDDPAPSRFVSEKTGVPVVMLPYTVGGTPAAADFISFYRDSVERLLSGLNGVGRT